MLLFKTIALSDLETSSSDTLLSRRKLKAVDALEMSDEFQDEEYEKIINALIDNEQLKEWLSKSHAALCKDLQDRSSSSYQSPSLSEIYM